MINVQINFAYDIFKMNYLGISSVSHVLHKQVGDLISEWILYSRNLQILVPPCSFSGKRNTVLAKYLSKLPLKVGSWKLIRFT